MGDVITPHGLLAWLQRGEYSGIVSGHFHNPIHLIAVYIHDTTYDLGVSAVRVQSTTSPRVIKLSTVGLEVATLPCPEWGVDWSFSAGRGTRIGNRFRAIELLERFIEEYCRG